eukprot:6180135-Pleurochrysis_carterae.AAC.4
MHRDCRRALRAPRRATRLEPTDMYSLWWRKSRRQPHHKNTIWARLAARGCKRVASALQELACVVEAKEADTRTVSSLTSDRKPRRLKASRRVLVPRRAVTRSRGPTCRAVGTRKVDLCPLWRSDRAFRAVRSGLLTLSCGVTNNQWSGSSVGARAERACAAASMRGRGGAESTMRAWCQGSLGSGARALRKYACNADAKWQTVHASDGLGRATALARIVRRARVKKVNNRAPG